MSDFNKNGGRTNVEIIGKESGTLKRANLITRVSDSVVSVPTQSIIKGASGTEIGNTGDSLKTSALQSGTWNITNVSGTVSLPTGASTSANQTTINLSIQETHGSVSAGTAATKSELVGGVYNTSSPTLTNGQQVALQLDSSGNLKTNITNSLSISSGSVTATGNVASGASDSGNPVKVGAVYNSTVPTFTNGQRSDLQSDTTGSVYVNTEIRKTTYRAYVQFNPAASATDVFTIYGSATKTVRVVSFFISGTNTANTNAVVIVNKRSTANTGGTSASVTAVPLDSNNASATATVKSWTTNPTLGTLIGSLVGDLVFLPALSSTNPVEQLNFDFGNNGQPIVLRGTSEGAALNMNGVNIGILSATTLYISVEWTEE